MLKVVVNFIAFVALTLLTQIGGIAWLIALYFQHKYRAFFVCYFALTLLAFVAAPLFGRVALPCLSGQGLRVLSPLYCALNRHYVTPELKAVLQELSQEMNDKFPETDVLVLDANFPFVTGFPLLPHLSHDDGNKVDLAYFYQNDQGYLPGVTKSPIGYFAFEKGPTNCPKKPRTLRWDLEWLQGLWPNYRVEPLRMRAVLQLLSGDNRVGKIFIEPHLAARLQVQNSKIRFQGCRAARHDDHIHLQL